MIIYSVKPPLVGDNLKRTEILDYMQRYFLSMLGAFLL